MAKQIVQIGSVANDGTGDPLRTAFGKLNDNFTELYGFVFVDATNNNEFFGSAGNRSYTGSNVRGVVAIGTGAAALLQYANDCVFIGSASGANIVGTSGEGNTVVGNTGVGRFTISEAASPKNCTAVGDSALRRIESNGSTAVGYVCGEYVSTGLQFCGFGLGAGGSITTGNYNNVYGASGMVSLVGGHRNNGFGTENLYECTGDDNAAYGHYSLRSTTQFGVGNPTGENAAFGNFSGFHNTNGIRNTWVGTSSGNNALQKVDAINSTALGYLTYTTKSDQVVLGNSSVTETLLRGNCVFTSLSASATPANNGELVIEQTANTTITIKLKGSDGTVRSVALTLA